MKTGQRVTVNHNGENIQGEVIHVKKRLGKELFVIDSLMSEYLSEEQIVN